MKKTIVWLRSDLRLHDNPALWEAAERGKVIPVFIHSNEKTGEATNWWLHQSLIDLQKSFSAKGLSLILRSGNELDELQSLLDETKADAVFFNERYEPTPKKIDRAIIRTLTAHHIDVRAFHGNLLFNPNELLNKKNEPYKVFTSFWKRFSIEQISRPYPIPNEFHPINQEIRTLTVDELELLPSIQWHSKLAKHWHPSECDAITRWTDFIENDMQRYKIGRDFPVEEAVSNLSPYIAYGNISVKSIWHATKRQFDASSDAEAFLRQLMWREFAYHQLIHFPHILHTPLRAQFKDFPWQGTSAQLTMWKRGKTGYPFIDAGMRELWATGAMHNRVRMVVASFLVKHLLIPWTAGSDWFKETLVDFDAANNALGWQWVTGCGIDSAPYFRIFNPILQSEKFDKNGEYIRKWIPELAQLPNKYIHKPWEAPDALLDDAGITLDVTYPRPIVDHTTARNRALAAFQGTKKSST